MRKHFILSLVVGQLLSCSALANDSLDFNELSHNTTQTITAPVVEETVVEAPLAEEIVVAAPQEIVDLRSPSQIAVDSFLSTHSYESDGQRFYFYDRAFSELENHFARINKIGSYRVNGKKLARYVNYFYKQFEKNVGMDEESRLVLGVPAFDANMPEAKAKDYFAKIANLPDFTLLDLDHDDFADVYKQATIDLFTNLGAPKNASFDLESAIAALDLDDNMAKKLRARADVNAHNFAHAYKNGRVSLNTICFELFDFDAAAADLLKAVEAAPNAHDLKEKILNGANTFREKFGNDVSSFELFSAEEDTAARYYEKVTMFKDMVKRFFENDLKDQDATLKALQEIIFRRVATKMIYDQNSDYIVHSFDDIFEQTFHSFEF